ncbi:unnamed protein product [marine sediment metagenome]|uniref:Uncharacterized protein n=1 Tax=marine sediment metagenome TaxID=412755 RepID=X1BKR5_9ZZZZ
MHSGQIPVSLLTAIKQFGHIRWSIFSPLDFKTYMNTTTKTPSMGAATKVDIIKSRV